MSHLAAVEAAPQPGNLAPGRPDLRLVHSVTELETDFEPVGQRPDLHAVPDFEEAVSVGAGTEAAHGAFVNADTVPELAAKRREVAKRSAAILSKNRHLLYEGHAEQVPQPVDILGTARKLRIIGERFGTGSPEYKEVRNGLNKDMERLVGEAASTSDPEHFGRIRQVFDPEKQEYFSYGLSVSEMTRNGLSPRAHPEEQDRRINENIEEDGTLVPIGSMIAADGLRATAERLGLPLARYAPKISVETTTISMCTDYALEAYAANPNGTYGGYRPAIEAMAIRRNYHEDDSGSRDDEQVIIPGTLITPDIVRGVLAEEGAIRPNQKLGKTELHGTQFLTANDGSIMNFVRRLDLKAGEAHGKNIFMGEEVPDGHPKDYGAFIEGAQERRDCLVPLPDQLAELTIELEAQGMDSETAETIVRDVLKTKMLAIAKRQPDMAEAMFDKATADGLERVARLESEGRHDEAQRLQIEVKASAPDPDYCSGGGGGGGSTYRDQMEKAAKASNLLDENAWHGGEVHFNSKCVSCEETKGVVGACYICEDCVHSPKEDKK